MQAAAGGGSAPPTRSRLVTWRVVAFVVVLLGVLAAAAVIVTRGGTAWAVTLEGSTVVVKEGDQIRESKPLQVNQLPADIQAELRRGKRVDDRAGAEAYIDGITRRAVAAGTLQPPGAGVVVPSTATTAGLPAPGPGATLPGGAPPSAAPAGP
jgi:hypothetical protein